MGDALFPVYNNFFIGNYQVCINEAYELSNLSGTDAIERDCYLYRSHIASSSQFSNGSHGVALCLNAFV